ncbi:MAG TPA: flagellar biosynthesis protein FlhF [Blastocatellia bacterium]|nr:flagellar biosynthesis protein FlhF [Blastocatellia bacterium]
MKVKRYEASTMQAALEMVKDELGPNAFVLSTQRKTRKGLLGIGSKEVVEIQAAEGDDPSMNSSDKVVVNDSRLKTPQTSATQHIKSAKPSFVAEKDQNDDFEEMASFLPYAKTSRTTTVAKTAPVRTPSAPTPAPVVAPLSFEDELRNITEAINGIVAESDLRATQILPRVKPAKPVPGGRTYKTARVSEAVKAAVAPAIMKPRYQPAPAATRNYMLEMENHFSDLGMDKEVASLLLQSTDSQIDSMQALKSQVSLRLSQIVTPGNEDELLKGNVRAAVMLGPTGIGKTTTIAKLAARAILKFNRKVVLVTLDTFRIGAIKQLGTYADIIGVPLKVAKTASELEAHIAESPSDALVLIDTIGRSPYRLGELEELTTYFSETSQIRKYLILSATTNAADNLDIAAHFDGFGIEHTVITKADETIRHGGLINCLARLGKPVDYITAGQNVPEDIQTANEEVIANLLLDRVKS